MKAINPYSPEITEGSDPEKKAHKIRLWTPLEDLAQLVYLPRDGEFKRNDQVKLVGLHSKMHLGLGLALLFLKHKSPESYLVRHGTNIINNLKILKCQYEILTPLILLKC